MKTMIWGIDDVMENVEGWFLRDEAITLESYAKLVSPPATIVEIGSYRGRSTIVLAQACPGDVMVYAIDPHIMNDGDPFPFGNDDRRVFSENILAAQVADKVCPVNLESHAVAQIWNKPVGLLFVDGQHSYEGVRRDLDGWVPRVVDDGIIAAHDTDWETVARALDERTDIELVQRASTLSIFKKKRWTS
jgi:predicted O-methyltransferase YrrM